MHLKFVDNRTLRPAETALALKLVTKTDLLRLKTIARLYARGLPPDVAWDDLLQEAITRVLTGSRRHRGDVPMVAFLAGTMRSLRAEHWRRVLKRRDTYRLDERAGHEVELRDPSPELERSLIARQELHNIEKLFSGDATALTVIKGLGEGLTADEIRAAAGISKVDYDSARRRMRRALLREGLTCEKT